MSVTSLREQSFLVGESLIEDDDVVSVEEGGNRTGPGGGEAIGDEGGQQPRVPQLRFIQPILNIQGRLQDVREFSTQWMRVWEGLQRPAER